MFDQTYSYDDATALITKKRLRGCSLVISLPIDTKMSYMYARPIRRSGMSNINVRALATMGIQKNYLRNIIKASCAMKVTSWSVGFSFEDMLIF